MPDAGKIRLNPEAALDCLFVAHRLQMQSAGFAGPELHLFAYLACLLWLYRQRAATDWGYSFVGTELGAPFSLEINESVNELLARSYFVRVGERLHMTELAQQPLHDFARLVVNQERMECLQAACASTAAFSVGMISTALAEEPELRRAHAVPASRHLLEESAQTQLYVHFNALRQALRERGNDLRLPAIVWLSALYRSSESAVVEE